MASLRFPGPLCRYRLSSEIDTSGFCPPTYPLAGPIGELSLWPELHAPNFLAAGLGVADPAAPTDADKAEFAVIRKMPVYDRRRRPYATLKSYVSDRSSYFGPGSAYAAFAAASDNELANTKWVGKKRTRTLRSMLEFGKNTQQQQIFYRWVRKAYKRKFGDDVNVPELIRQGMSQELADKVAQVRGSIRVKKIHDEQFKAGGFNPRPIKYNKHYLLGTLSEHATGMAVDIDDSQNAQLTIEEWKFIETLTGKHVVRSGRWTTEETAAGLWQDIWDVNDLFVKKVAAETQRIVRERAETEAKEKPAQEKAEAETGKQSAPRPAPVLKPPLEQILEKHFKSLSPWAATGFFHLPLELVLEFHGHGFTWGATFSTNVDLHHFELKE